MFGQLKIFPLTVPIDGLKSSKRQAISLLETAISSLKEQIEEIEESEGSTRTEVGPSPPNLASNRNVFIVHGHDVGVRETVARFLEGCGFQPIILLEMPSRGQTIIEKFEANTDVGFAVVLLTPDDEVLSSEGGGSQRRARQNVILELGYFIGKLGRERVCALKSGDVEIPSDILGVVYTPMDEGNGWQQDLAKELSAAGYEVDWNKVMKN